MKKFMIITDLEGPAGVDKFLQTRDGGIEHKKPAMELLTSEVNACVEGIREVCEDAQVDVWDGHGSGGLLPELLKDCSFIPSSQKPYFSLEGYTAMLFVGQHAMAGTFSAPLCHTYSSKHIMYYRLNGVFIGEFGSRALVAGLQGVPTIFLSGDDKAVYEASVFIPEIETVPTKWGKGLEAAVHVNKQAACTNIREGSSRAVQRLNEIPPFTGFQPPFVFEARFMQPVDRNSGSFNIDAVWLDSRTYTIESEDITKLPF